MADLSNGVPVAIPHESQFARLLDAPGHARSGRHQQRPEHCHRAGRRRRAIFPAPTALSGGTLLPPRGCDIYAMRIFARFSAAVFALALVSAAGMAKASDSLHWDTNQNRVTADIRSVELLQLLEGVARSEEHTSALQSRF